MESACQERKVAIVVIGNGICQCLILERQEVLEIDVKGGEVVDAKTVDLGDVVFVACYSTRRNGTRQ